MFHTEPHAHRRHAIKLAHDLGWTAEDKATIQPWITSEESQRTSSPKAKIPGCLGLRTNRKHKIVAAKSTMKLPD